MNGIATVVPNGRGNLRMRNEAFDTIFLFLQILLFFDFDIGVGLSPRFF